MHHLCYVTGRTHVAEPLEAAGGHFAGPVEHVQVARRQHLHRHRHARPAGATQSTGKSQTVKHQSQVGPKGQKRVSHCFKGSLDLTENDLSTGVTQIPRPAPANQRLLAHYSASAAQTQGESTTLHLAIQADPFF